MGYQHPSGRFIDTFDSRSKQEPEDPGHRSDNGVWSIYTAYAYLAESGDYEFLKKKTPYYKGEVATLFDHLWQALKYMVDNAGQNGLPLMFGQDWNDSLYMFKEEGEETVMLAQKIVYACTLFRETSEMVEKLDSLLCGFHAKDVKIGTSNIVLGEGYSGFFKTIDSLKKCNYSGYIHLENDYRGYLINEACEDQLLFIKKDIEVLKNTLE